MDAASILFPLFGLGFLMVCSSFFSGSETALSALTKAQIQRMREDARNSCAAIVRFLDEPRRLFITVLFGNILVNMAFVTITGSLIYHSRFFDGKPEKAGLASLLAILIETFFLLIFGEITPKTYAIKHSEKFSMVVARPLWLFSKLIFPFRKVLRWLTDILLPLFGVKSFTHGHPITSDELRAIVKATEAEGALDEQEGEIIHNIFELRDIEAKEAMVPRTKMVCVEVSMTIQEAFDKTKEVGHSRLPVYQKDIDNICGIFYVKDLPRWRGLIVEELGDVSIEQLTIDDFLSHRMMLEALNPNNENTLVRRPPFFVLETKKIGTLMLEMTREKHQMAILRDEYGGVSGLITVEDIVEEVVGEIIDEYDVVDGRPIERDPSDPNVITIDGLVSLRSVNRLLKLKLDESIADTLGGYVASLFGSIPNEEDFIPDEVNQVEFEVVQMDGSRIDRVKISPKEEAEEQEANASKFPLIFLLLFCVALIAASGGGYPLQGNWLLISAFSSMLILSLILTGFYAGSETAVVSANRARIEVLAEEGNKRATIIKKLLDAPDEMLGMVLVGTNLMTTAAGQSGVILTNFAFPGQERLQYLVNTVVMTLLILIFCEILPKTAFRAKADTLALHCAPALRISAILLYPIVMLVTKLTNFAVNLMSGEDKNESTRIMREELKLLSTMGEEEGAIEEEQVRMIHSVLNLGTRTIEKVMVPLVDIVAIPMNTKIDDFYKKVAETGFSRIPVYKDRVYDIIGLVNILDVLYKNNQERGDISPFIREDVSYEPESKRVETLLRELQHSRNSMAFVVDEYGGVIGLVTIEDLVEEIVGEIRDEKDMDEEEYIHPISDKVIECDGRAEILELNHSCGTNIPTGTYETIAGYVISLMEKIPKEEDTLETDDLNITILEADEKSVRRVRILKKRSKR